MTQVEGDLLTTLWIIEKRFVIYLVIFSELIHKH